MHGQSSKSLRIRRTEINESKDRHVNVFSSSGFDAKMQCGLIHGLLESAGIKSMIVRQNVPELPVGRMRVRILESQAEEAQQVIEAAKQAGQQ